jgi:hypothetical protein
MAQETGGLGVDLNAMDRAGQASAARQTKQAASGLREANESLRSEHDRQASVYGMVRAVSGFILCNGAGELQIEVNFPVRFVEKPAMTFGGELDVNQPVEAGNFPTISVVVTRWILEELDELRTYFVGASLAVVSTGVANQRMWGHWTATGAALLGSKSEDVAL